MPGAGDTLEGGVMFITLQHTWKPPPRVRRLKTMLSFGVKEANVSLGNIGNIPRGSVLSGE